MFCVIDCGSSKVSTFNHILNEFGVKSEIIEDEQIKQINFLEYEGIIISGSPNFIKNQDINYLIQKFSFIKNLNIPILGVCFGHQIISLVFGGSCKVGIEVRDYQDISIIKDDAIFNELIDYTFLEDHCEHVNLPEKFVLLANSKTCENEAMKHNERNIYGVQFHPEVSGENGRMLLKNFVKICREQSQKSEKEKIFYENK